MESQATIRTEAKPERLREVLLAGARQLIDAGIDTARLDAEALMCHALGMGKAELYRDLDAELKPEHERRFRELLRRRTRREPIAYITGQKEFWSMDYRVTPDVLIPRPETELLVEVALKRSKLCGGAAPVKILDLGTGSGAIAIALAKELPAARIAAVDVSTAALEVARRNSARHGVAGRIRFLHGNLFEPIAAKRQTFDLIVSNPPYIRSGELSDLSPEVRRWEPIAALDGGIDGLDYYRRIIAEAHRYLEARGHIILEISADMGNAVTDLFACAGCYALAFTYQDYAGRDRVIATTKDLSSNFTKKGSNRG